MKKIISISIIFLFVIIMGCSKEIKLGSDRDEHGCIGSAGYTWCEAKDKCLRLWEEPCKDSALITSFDECEKAGYPIMESYPRQCNTPDGKNFVEVINEPAGNIDVTQLCAEGLEVYYCGDYIQVMSVEEGDISTYYDDSGNEITCPATDSNDLSEQCQEIKNINCEYACLGIGTDEEFCGISTYGECNTDSECVPGGCSGQLCSSINDEELATICDIRDCYNAEKFGVSCKCLNNQCQWA